MINDNANEFIVAERLFKSPAKARHENMVTALQTDGDNPVIKAKAQRHKIISKLLKSSPCLILNNGRNIN